MSSAMPAQNSETLEETLDRHRRRLETSLEKLRKALTQWHTYNAEYEALAEELTELPEGASREDMLEVGKSFGGTVVDISEVGILLGDKIGIRRTRNQVIEAIKHRITYVTENIARVEKQIDKGETQLSSLYFIQGDQVVTEEGDPVVEITEELDDFGNIISSSTSVPGGGQATKLNVTDLEQFERFIQRPEIISTSPKVTEGAASKIADENPNDTEIAKTSLHSIPNNTDLLNLLPEPAKQHYVQAGFNEISMSDLANEQSGDTLLQEISIHDIRLDAALEHEKRGENNETEVQTLPIPMGLDTDAITIETKSSPPHMEIDQEVRPETAVKHALSIQQPKEEDFVLMVDEPPDEADLRRQMINYNLHDVGAIVAELTLEEESEFGDEFDEEEYDDEESEDRYGRSTNRLMTEEMYNEMRTLQARIKARQGRENQEKPQVNFDAEAKPDQRALEIKVTKDQNSTASDDSPKKKGVRFSDKLDVAPSSSPAPAQAPYTLPPLPQPDPDDALPFLVELLARHQMEEDLKSQGIDKAKLNEVVEQESRKEKKPSIFKSRKAETTLSSSQTMPSPKMPIISEGTELKAPISTSIVERDARPITALPTPDTASSPIMGDASKDLSRSQASGSSKTTAPSFQKVLTTEPSLGIYQNTFTQKDTVDDDNTVYEQNPRPVLSAAVVERLPTNFETVSSAVAADAPHELDPAIHRQEVRMDYFKTRNRLIQKEGGFLPREEEEMYIPLNEGTAEKKKVSRFKAARLRGNQQ